MIVVLSSYELVNIAYYILIPWSTISASDAVAVVAMSTSFGRWAGILLAVLVAVSCAGSITTNVFTIGRLTIVASQRQYLPAFLSQRGLPWRQSQVSIQCEDSGQIQTNVTTALDQDKSSYFDAPM